MTDEWRQTTLGEVLSFSNGASSPERSDNGSTVVFGSNGPIGLADEANAPTNTIVIGRVGSYCGSLRFSKQRCWVTDNAIKANAKDCNSPLFLFYLLQTLNLNTWRGGSGQPLLNQRTLSAIPSSVPRPETQYAIAALLGSLDDKIEQNRRTGQKLEALARAVFKAWFVDFEPVKAKAAGATAFPGMPADTFATLPTRLVDSELGPVPEGWRIGKVCDLGDVVCGKTPPTSNPENYGDDVDFITIPDMHGKVFVSNTTRKLSSHGAVSQQNKFVPARSIAVSCIATPGLVVMTAGRAQTNQQINTVVPYPSVDCYFCYELLVRLGDEIRAAGSGGSVFHNLNKSSFQAIQIALPIARLISAYGTFAKPIFDALLAAQNESSKLAALRNYLLPLLLSGRSRCDRNVNLS